MSADPKTPMDEAREALAEYDALPEADNLDTMLDNAGRIIRLQEHAPDHLRAALAEADRLTAENARLREALAWALGEGPDPGAWPADVPLPSCASDFLEVSALRAPTDAEAPALVYPPPFGDATRGWKFRRSCAARRVLAEMASNAADVLEQDKEVNRGQ